MFVPNGSGGPQSTGDALYLASLDRAWHRQSRPMRVTIAPAAKPNRVMTPPRYSDRGAAYRLMAHPVRFSQYSSFHWGMIANGHRCAMTL
jgi:hypothetical protein